MAKPLIRRVLFNTTEILISSLLVKYDGGSLSSVRQEVLRLEKKEYLSEVINYFSLDGYLNHISKDLSRLSDDALILKDDNYFLSSEAKDLLKNRVNRFYHEGSVSGTLLDLLDNANIKYEISNDNLELKAADKKLKGRKVK